MTHAAATLTSQIAALTAWVCRTPAELADKAARIDALKAQRAAASGPAAAAAPAITVSRTVLVADHSTRRGVLATVTKAARRSFTVESARLHNPRGRFAMSSGSAEDVSPEHGYRLRAHACLHRPEITLSNAPAAEKLINIRRCGR